MKRLPLVRSLSLAIALASLPACSGADDGAKTAPPPTPKPTTTDPAPADEAPPAPDPAQQRPTMTADECAASGGTVIGDIGDGAVHRPDYTCANGEAPIGTIAAPAGEPTPVEGAVCCPG